ncbi:GNAT family N-acetyltransferase [Fulvivirgaceae bacterium PWU4]|uniref:GNAT family N-acetyltransferase n=1 Tax=Chryseosolibacter histidini TaxID=2782349 RepID=A0AAP2DLE0_9BACT|nr:N-acetyltransferase [Chryseosolibacter histidini]MBT1696059.1 GNAT family N-acetyltransferase [Chryseosolibacter histidini]
MHKLEPLQTNHEKERESGVSVKDTGSDKHKATGSAARAVYSIDETSAEAAYATIVLAFTSDPAARWSWPRADDYLRNMPLLARAFSWKSFGLGTAFGMDGLAGAALWLPPGASSDEESLASLFECTTPASIHQDFAGVFEKMANFHPHEPHWYLPLIGVDPACQGQRLGDKLMAHALARCDADRLPAYLESSNPRNIPFYQRHGFEEMGKIQVGSSPTIVPMLRRPRAPR